MPIVTATTANARNGITSGRSRVTVRTEWLLLVGSFEVPSRMPRAYLKKHTRGTYAKKMRHLEAVARKLERDQHHGNQLPLLIAS